MTRELDGALIRVANTLLEGVAADFHGRLAAALELGELRALGAEGAARALAEWDGTQELEPFVVSRVRWSLIDGLRHLSRQAERAHQRPALLAVVAAQRAAETASLGAAPEAERAAELAKNAAVSYGLELDAVAAVGEGAPSTARGGARMELRSAVERLPEPKRLVIERHYYRGETFDEVAAALRVDRQEVLELHAGAIALLREQSVT